MPQLAEADEEPRGFAPIGVLGEWSTGVMGLKE